MAEITLRKVEPHSWQHAHGDKRPATRYEVLVDDQVIGTVESRSSESWRKHGRIRYGMRGYAREWRGNLIPSDYRTEVTSYQTRARCVELLVERWEESRA